MEFYFPIGSVGDEEPMGRRQSFSNSILRTWGLWRTHWKYQIKLNFLLFFLLEIDDGYKGHLHSINEHYNETCVPVVPTKSLSKSPNHKRD